MFMRYMKVLGMGVMIMGVLAAMAPLNAGAEETKVVQGNTAGVHFTCRLPNGDVAVSTHQAVGDDTSIKRSNIFLKRDRDTPVEIMAGVVPENLKDPDKRGFEGEVIYQLSMSIKEMPVGSKQIRMLKAERLPERKKGEHILKMARVRKRPKEMRFKAEEYKNRTGKAPGVGQPFVIDPALPGSVVSVTESEVVVKFSATPGKTVMTPFGKGTIREFDDRYEIAINAIPGTLVRSSGLVGRVVQVDENFITIDYGHPFGGEVLTCDVLVEWARSGKKENVSQASEH